MTKPLKQSHPKEFVWKLGFRALPQDFDRHERYIRKAVPTDATIAFGRRFEYSKQYMRIDLPQHYSLAFRAGPGCLNRISATISGASAGVRPPSGMAVG